MTLEQLSACHRETRADTLPSYSPSFSRTIRIVNRFVSRYNPP